MSISRAKPFLWPLVVVFAATIGLKIAIVRQGPVTDQASVAVARQHIVDRLRRHQFGVSALPHNGIAMVEARRHGCEMTIVVVDARGVHRELLSAMRPVGADLFFVHKGVIHPAQPIGRTMLAHHLWARSRDLGIRLPRPLVLGVIGSGCSRHVPPWAELATVP